MAFPTSPTTEAANKVRQKAYNAVYGNATTTYPNSPFNFYAFKALFLHLAINKGNPDLRFVEVNGLYSSSDGTNTASQVLCDGPCTLYAIFLRKRGSTENIFKGTNHATTAATNGTQDIAIAATVAGTVVEIYPDGRALDTGFTVTENTTRTGSTLTLKADRMDGFIIIAQ
jgi:hypothetical protein